MIKVSKSQFKSRALHFFRIVEKSGRPITITDRGRPVLRVVPYPDTPDEIIKGLRHSVIRYDKPLEPVGAEDWEALK